MVRNIPVQEQMCMYARDAAEVRYAGKMFLSKIASQKAAPASGSEEN